MNSSYSLGQGPWPGPDQIGVGPVSPGHCLDFRKPHPIPKNMGRPVCFRLSALLFLAPLLASAWGPPVPLLTPYHTEQEWIISSVCRNIFAAARLRTAGLFPSGGEKSHTAYTP
jgi:hypothetical protein